jgi:hypothetical protein
MNFFKNITELTNRNHKTWKTLYKFTLLKNYLNENNILFFYYDFITIEDNYKLKLLLKSNNLSIIKLKKNTILNLLNDPLYNNFKNIFKNNTLIITSDNKEIFLNKSIMQTLNEIKNIHAVGFWYNKKFYRPTEYNQLLKLNTDSKKKPFFLIKNQLNILKNTLTLKKNS